MFHAVAGENDLSCLLPGANRGIEVAQRGFDGPCPEKRHLRQEVRLHFFTNELVLLRHADRQTGEFLAVVVPVKERTQKKPRHP